MKLKNNLYTIKDKQLVQPTDGGTTSGRKVLSGSYELELNPSCFIYQAHFPGEPITPGVCIMQMGQEVLEDALEKTLQVIAVKNIKFLSIISPKETTCITYLFKKVELSEDEQSVKAQLVVMVGEEAKAKISFTLKA
nr:hydroxymyristoyl-ACP dehydratase [uncultured Prevotella sp.]